MTVLNIKAGNRLLLRADKMAQIAITAKQINIKRQRIEEVVDCTDAAAHAFLFWKKATKPVLMSPVPKVNLTPTDRRGCGLYRRCSSCVFILEKSDKTSTHESSA